MRVTELLCASFLVFGVLLVWPVLTISNRPALVLGVPALVFYLFGVWAAIVAVLAWAAGRRGPDEP